MVLVCLLSFVGLYFQALLMSDPPIFDLDLDLALQVTKCMHV